MKGVVVAPQPQAVEAGRAVLLKDGNAIDAAIATALVQGIVDPMNAGIGGFGCIQVYSSFKDEVKAISFHGEVGSKASPEVFADDVVGQIAGHAERFSVKDDVNQIGYKSVTVPGVVRGFWEAHSRFGRIAWEELFQPAIRLARDGWTVEHHVWEAWHRVPDTGHRDARARLNFSPYVQGIYTNDGEFLLPGTLLRNLDYARSLERIAEGGVEVFYSGEIADRIAEDFSENGGFVTKADLESYRAEVTDPVGTEYRESNVTSVPLPASGGQLIQLLKIVEGFDLSDIGFLSSEYVDILARTMQIIFRDRALYLGDPKFIDVPRSRLLSDSYVEECQNLVRRREVIEVPKLTAVKEGRNTTHTTVIDEEGNVCTLTHTLGSCSGVATPDLGFMYNNAMYQFHPIPGNPNSIAQGKRRLTGIAPTIVWKEDQPYIALGAPGGTKIFCGIFQVILGVIDFGLPLVEAVSAPRLYIDSDELRLEARIYFALKKVLEAEVWKLKYMKSYDSFFSLVQAALKDEDRIIGASDPRGGGGVAGLT
jgi:gamma-glutamyltranspeptidase/glutathione hydrolase